MLHSVYVFLPRCVRALFWYLLAFVYFVLSEYESVSPALPMKHCDICDITLCMCYHVGTSTCLLVAWAPSRLGIHQSWQLWPSAKTRALAETLSWPLAHALGTPQAKRTKTPRGLCQPRLPVASFPESQHSGNDPPYLGLLL